MSRGWRLVLAAAGAAVVAAAVWADVRAPASRTIGVIPVPGAASLARPEGTPPDARRAWRMVLRLDPDLRQPGPTWALREGLTPGLGYELAWQPQQLALQLTRGGSPPLLLGTARLTLPPNEVVLVRRGAVLAVDVDGARVLDVIDPEGAPEPRLGRPFPDGWSVVTPSSLGSTTFAVHDEGFLPAAFASDLDPGDHAALAQAIAAGPVDPGERLRAGIADIEYATTGYREPPPPPRSDHALLMLRKALIQRADREPLVAEAALGEAARAVAALGSAHPHRRRLALWMAFAEARGELQRAGPDDGAMVRPVLEQLAVLVERHPTPEGPGLLLALLPRIAAQAVRRPASPTPLVPLLDQRAAWLATLDATARAAARAMHIAPDPNMALELQFISHACGVFGGASLSPSPLPAGAPDWLTARWRAIAGGDPPPGGLPLPERSPVTRSPLLPVIETLMRSVVLDPLAGVRLRAALADPPTPGSAELRSRMDAAPRREALLTQAILALHALPQPTRQDPLRRTATTPEQAAAIEAVRNAMLPLGSVDLLHSEPRAEALVRYDPLAFALACLAESRMQRFAPSRPGGLGGQPWRPPTPGAGPFVRLAPFAQLLAGEAASTELIWLHDDTILPPAQALGAALAMREVREDERRRLAGRPLDAGAQPDPDWSLTRRLRSYVLPLERLDNQQAPEPGPNREAPPRQAPLAP